MATDDFNRADNNSLGANWTESEVAATDLLISTNLLVADDSNGADVAFSYWNNEDFGGNHYSQLEFRAFNAPGLGQPQSGPAVRIPTSATRASFSGYVALCDPSGQAVNLRKWVLQSLTSAGTDLIAAASGVTFTAGDIFRIEAEGQLITVKKNSATLLSVTDSSLSGGRPGVVVKEGYSL